VTTDALTIAIPTRDSAKYIDLIASFYREHDIKVKMFVDPRSEDGTLQIARLLTETIAIPNCTAMVVEGMLQSISEECGSKWVLRIDDDELPSLAMLQFIRDAIKDDTKSAYGFLRHQCIVSHRGELLTAPGCSPEVHRQWRLYQPAKVKFVEKVHSPGIEWDGGDAASPAPAAACLIHLDWALHSYNERRQKVERYDAYAQGAGTVWRDYYLYEEKADVALVEFGLPEFGSVAATIARRLPNLCASATHTPALTHTMAAS